MIINEDTDVTTQEVDQNNTTTVQAARRGRPRISVNWPEENFTFSSLLDSNVLSTSSLRKKMRMELAEGGLVKVDTLKTAFGRPLNVYKKGGSVKTHL